MKKLFFVIFIHLFCLPIFGQTILDSLAGFDMPAAANFISANNLSASEQTIFLSKKKREYINSAFGIGDNSLLLNAKPIASTFSVMAGNIDFETGNTAGWTITSSTNSTSIPQQFCCPVSTVFATVFNGGFDTNLGFNLNSPLNGNHVIRLNPTTLVGAVATKIENTLLVTSSNNTLRIAAKYILEQATHSCNIQPYATVKITVLSNSLNIFNKFIQANEATSCYGSNFNNQVTQTTVGNNIVYLNSSWDVYCVDLTPYIGQTIKIEAISSECSAYGHGGYAYFDFESQSYSTSITNTISVNNSTYSINTQPLTLPICATNTAIVTGPSGAASYTWQGTNITGLTTQSVSINQPGTYSLSYSIPASAANCVSSSSVVSVKLIIGTASTINVTATPSVCLGNQATLNFSGASSYSVTSSTGNNLVNSSGQVIFVPSVNTTYSVFGIGALGCSPTTTLNVIVAPVPTISIAGNNFCSNVTGTMTASGANSYTWSNLSTVVSTTNQLVLTPTISGYYNITGMNSFGCSSGYNFNTVVSSNTLYISPSPQVCIGSAVTLYGNGPAANTLTWSTGSQGQSISLSPTVTTNYSLSANTGCGNFSIPFTLTVNPLPNVNIVGSNTVCPGAGPSLCGNGASSYMWSLNTPSNSYYNFSSSVCVSVGNGSNTYTFSLTGTDANSCSNTSTFVVNSITVTPFVINTNPINVCSGNPSTITLSGAQSYSWNTGSTASTAVISPTSTVGFFIIATYSNGCTQNNNTNIFVNNNTPTVTPVLQNSYTVCSGNPVNLNQQYQCCGATYSINAIANLNNGDFIPSASGIYTLSIENPCGITTQTFNVIVNPTPTLNVIIADSACKNSIISYTATGATNYNYIFGPSTGTNALGSFSLANSGNFILQGSQNGCVANNLVKFIKALPIPTVAINNTTTGFCAGATETYSAPASAFSYTWNNTFIGNPFIYTINTNTTITVAVTGTNGCINNVNITATLIPPPAITINANPTSVCPGGLTYIYSSSTANTFSWSNGSQNFDAYASPTVTTVYTLTASGPPFYCPGTQTISILVMPAPNIGFTQSPYSLCAGNSAVLTATGANSYTWSSPYTISSSITVNPATTTTYQVTGKNLNNCTSTQTVILNVNPNPTLSISNPNYTLCSGNSATINVNGANSYSWSNSAISNSIIVSPTISTAYQVIGTSVQGCTAYASPQITVLQSPSLSVNLAQSSNCGNITATLTANGANTYTWSTGSTTNPLIISASTSTLFFVDGSNFFCTSSSSPITVSVFPIPIVNIAASASIECLGNVITLNGTPAGGNYLYNTSSISNTFTALNAGNYTLTYSYTSPAGCSATNTTMVAFSVCTNIKNVIASSPIICYPNPFKDEIIIHAENLSDFSINLYDQLGRVIIYEIKEEGIIDQLKINTSKLTEGLYFIEIRNQEIIKREKVIKN